MGKKRRAIRSQSHQISGSPIHHASSDWKLDILKICASVVLGYILGLFKSCGVDYAAARPQLKIVPVMESSTEVVRQTWDGPKCKCSTSFRVTNVGKSIASNVQLSKVRFITSYRGVERPLKSLAPDGGALALMPTDDLLLQGDFELPWTGNEALEFLKSLNDGEATLDVSVRVDYGSKVFPYRYWTKHWVRIRSRFGNHEIDCLERDGD